jgi:hypothetical protein
MSSVNRRSCHRFARPGALAALAGSMALAVAGCITVKATPEIIYVTPAPASASAALIPTPSGLLSSSSDAPTEAASDNVPSGTPSVLSQTVARAASDGRWTASFRKPVVGGVSDEAVAAMNASIGVRVDGYISAFEGSGLPAVNPGDGPSTFEGDFSVAYASPTVLSIRFSIETYVSGAASPNEEPGSINFNAITGASIQFVDLFTSAGDALPVLSSQSHSLLAKSLGAELDWPASVTMADFQSAWALTAPGLELTWAQGEIAPRAAGAPTITIPWSALKSVIAGSGPAAGFVS